MRLYQIRPSKDLDQSETGTYVGHASALIVDCLQVATDSSFYGVWLEGEIGMQRAPFASAFANARVIDLQSIDEVRLAVEKSLTDQPPFHMWIRSRITCRSVFPIHDSIAYLCLGTSDPPPRAAHPLIEVVECSQLLIDTDYLDGGAQ